MPTCPQDVRSCLVEHLTAEGVRLWLDDRRGGTADDGTLAELVSSGTISGVVLHHTAVAASGERRGASTGTAAPHGVEERARELVAVRGRTACAALEALFRASDGTHGRVSLPLPPRSSSAALQDEARWLLHRVGMPNAMVRVPATGRGLLAASALLGEGLSVHFAPVFSSPRYAQVVEAFVCGIERARAAGLAAPASMVTVGVARLDEAVDAVLGALGTPRALRMRGRAGVATARLVYHRYEGSLDRARWAELVAWGARPQSVAWSMESAAATPAQRVRRLARFIGWRTVHVLTESELASLEEVEPPAGDTLSGEQASACSALDEIASAGIDLDTVTLGLERRAAAAESEDWRALLAAVGGR